MSSTQQQQQNTQQQSIPISQLSAPTNDTLGNLQHNIHGLHPQGVDNGQSKPKVLMVLTSEKQKLPTGTNTGFFWSEMAEPYLMLTRNNFDVDFVSLTGQAYVDEASVAHAALSGEMATLYANKTHPIHTKLQHILQPSSVRPEQYVGMYVAGGHGCMWDLPRATTIQNLATLIWERGGTLALVCHGPCLFDGMRLSNGTSFIQGKQVTGFPTLGEKAMKLDDFIKKQNLLTCEEITKRNGGIWSAPVNPMGEHVVLEDRLITGANPASAGGVCEKMLQILMTNVMELKQNQAWNNSGFPMQQAGALGAAGGNMPIAGSGASSFRGHDLPASLNGPNFHDQPMTAGGLAGQQQMGGNALNLGGAGAGMLNAAQVQQLQFQQELQAGRQAGLGGHHIAAVPGSNTLSGHQGNQAALSGQNQVLAGSLGEPTIVGGVTGTETVVPNQRNASQLGQLNQPQNNMQNMQQQQTMSQQHTTTLPVKQTIATTQTVPVTNTVVSTHEPKAEFIPGGSAHVTSMPLNTAPVLAAAGTTGHVQTSSTTQTYTQ